MPRGVMLSMMTPQELDGWSEYFELLAAEQQQAQDSAEGQAEVREQFRRRRG